MTGHASPILTSLLDTDAHKLHMQQAIFHRYHDVTVAAEFRCHGDDLLGLYANEIRQTIDAIQMLVLTDDEYTYLSSLLFSSPTTLTDCAIFVITPSRCRCAITTATSLSASSGRGVK